MCINGNPTSLSISSPAVACPIPICPRALRNVHVSVHVCCMHGDYSNLDLLMMILVDDEMMMVLMIDDDGDDDR